LSYPIAKKLCFSEISQWNFYEKIRRLLHEGYLIERYGTNLEIDTLQLTKKGFEYIMYDLGVLKQNRFAAQSVTHDYWAMAFQLGEFAINPCPNVELFTEQELQCTDDSILPDWVPKSRDHFPDGFTRIKNENAESVFALEVELNLKPSLRYTKAAYYFDGLDSRTDVVFWLCDGEWLMERIFKDLSALRLRRMEVHHFLLLEDFLEIGWNAKLRSGREINKSVREVYSSRIPQTFTKEVPKSSQNGLGELFFTDKKSPGVSKI
jgi:hypothetical protein